MIYIYLRHGSPDTPNHNHRGFEERAVLKIWWLLYQLLDDSNGFLIVKVFSKENNRSHDVRLIASRKTSSAGSDTSFVFHFYLNKNNVTIVNFAFKHITLHHCRRSLWTLSLAWNTRVPYMHEYWHPPAKWGGLKRFYSQLQRLHR